ncbi:MAG: hypothetical protein L0K42_09060 [Acidipropionibacterium jensenii]|uniref:hypothetical protein n=1 Tax=Acidipropionibacterium jensenii TaxID=1749 RepID=UPI002649E869|nr:hypothetical protein [Acidipropionibacterium jensenii]MDN6480847.1 hypothetical protein [Acidipropionibacterium jensenii]
MVSDLPDNWFRPARSQADGDAGESDPRDPGERSGDEDAVETTGSGAGEPGEKTRSEESRGDDTLDPTTGGLLSLGDPDGEGPSVVVGHTAGYHRASGHGFDGPHGIRWSWVLLAAVLCMVSARVVGIRNPGLDSPDPPGPGSGRATGFQSVG